MSERDDWAEIEAKLEILRQRAQTYQDFVDPEGSPPLLWQMAMLADAGLTVLPRVDDPDPSKCFPELQVGMEPLDLSDEHYCLVGGAKFAVIPVPASYNGHLMLPKPAQPCYFRADALLIPTPVLDSVEHYRRKDYVLSVYGRRAWAARIMVCAGSRADSSR